MTPRSLASAAVLALAVVAHAQFSTVDVATRTKPSDAAPKTRPTRVLNESATFRVVPLDRFGGRADETYDKTGFFHAHRRDDGRWTLVDPDGNAFLSIGMNAVQPNPTTRGTEALQQRFGDTAGWARATSQQLRDAGFNTLACWSDFDSFKAAGVPMPYCTQLNFMSEYGKRRGGTSRKPGHTGYPNDCPFFFDPEFETFATAHAKNRLAATRDDPYLLGHFSDNELPLWKGMLGRYLKLPEGDPGRKAAEDWWTKRRGDDKREPTDADDDAFLEFVADRYYGIVGRAIHAADPNHMLLGSRLLNTSSKKAGVLRGMARHVDVMSVNYYYEWTMNPATTAEWARLTGKPYVVTEWYAKGADSGLANTGGAGWLVDTQADRGAFYQNFALSLLADPNCVGWHWFKYIDNDPTNEKTDPSNRDSNKGIVTNTYEPYPPLVERMTALNRAAYPLRDQLARPASQPAAALSRRGGYDRAARRPARVHLGR